MVRAYLYFRRGRWIFNNKNDPIIMVLKIIMLAAAFVMNRST